MLPVDSDCQNANVCLVARCENRLGSKGQTCGHLIISLLAMVSGPACGTSVEQHQSDRGLPRHRLSSVPSTDCALCVWTAPPAPVSSLTGGGHWGPLG